MEGVSESLGCKSSSTLGLLMYCNCYSGPLKCSLNRQAQRMRGGASMKNIINKTLLLVAAVTLMPSMANAERYLIQFESQQTFSAYSAKVKSQKELMGKFFNGPVRSGVQFMNSDAEVTDALNALKMIVVEADGDVDVSLLEQHPSVKYIEKEVMIPAPERVNSFGTYAVGMGSVTEFETPWGLKAVNAQGAWDASGQGEGARVMVLDTGVDKDHPALVGAFIEGKDFTESTGLPYPFFDDVGHGTHVAGTILGQNVGVAPAAKFYAGKVCGTEGCPSIAIVSGVNWAIEQGVDVVNMSLGGPFPSNRQVYEAAEAADVLIVAASGNDGREGIGYPAGHPTTFAVGAIDQTYNKAEFSQWGAGLDLVAPGTEVLSSVPQGTGLMSQAKADLGKGLEVIASAPMEGSVVTEDMISAEVVYAGLGKPEELEGLDLAGKVALIQRGEIAFGDKAKGAFAAGAIAVVIFNNAPGLTRGTLNAEMTIPVVMIGQEVGQAIADASAGGNFSMSVGVLRADYAELQGTSMATPHVAGVAALVRAANPELTSAEVKSILRSTADELDVDNSQNQVGAGLVNAKKAVEAALWMKANLDIAN